MRSLRLFLLALFSIAVAACDSGPGGSLYTPDAADGPAPVITAVSPEGTILAGISEITISGQHFSTTPGATLVFFDDGAGTVAQGEILSATETELRVKVPNLPNPNLRLRVSVAGATAFSNEVPAPLTPAVLPFGDLDTSPGTEEEPAGILGDGTGDLYVSLSLGGNAGGILRFDADGVRSEYAASPILWADFALAPDGLHGVQDVQALFRIPTVGRQQVVPPTLGFTVRLSRISGSPDGAVWAGGSAGTPNQPAVPQLYRFDRAGAAVATPFPGTVSDIRVFDGWVYVSAVRTGDVREAKVWRLPIQADGSLGAEEVVYDVAADQPGLRPSALAIAADGTVFVGIAPPLDNEELAVTHPIIRVLPDGSAAPLYPGVLPGPVRALEWGAGSTLYMVRGKTVRGSGESAVVTLAGLYAIVAPNEGP